MKFCYAMRCEGKSAQSQAKCFPVLRREGFARFSLPLDIKDEEVIWS